MDKKPLIILTGPTSVGKSALSISLAKAVGGEIISADSMQIYQFMDIGTAKLTREEMKGVPHYLIDEIKPYEEFNVFQFKSRAKEYIRQIHEKGKIPILVGGTGFYIQAVLYDIEFTENETDATYRRELEQLAMSNGSSYLHSLLKKEDPKSAEAIHPNNTKKIIRALEYVRLTGERISEHNEKQRSRSSPYRFCYFVLARDRAKLYEAINGRVDKMMKEGLLREVKGLSEKGYTRDMVSMQGLGYKELLAYLEGEYSLKEAVDLIKKETRHYAKRQLTWFKRERDVTWVDKEKFSNDDEILAYLLSELQKAGVLT